MTYFSSALNPGKTEFEFQMRLCYARKLYVQNLVETLGMNELDKQSRCLNRFPQRSTRLRGGGTSKKSRRVICDKRSFNGPGFATRAGLL